MSHIDDLLGVVVVATLAWLGALAVQPMHAGPADVAVSATAHADATAAKPIRRAT